MGDSHDLAEDLRAVIGRLVRSVRLIDTLTPAEAAVLGYLHRDGPQTKAELAQRRGVRHQSVAKSAKELMARGLVDAKPHPTDGRKFLLYLTPAGRERLDEERGRRADLLALAIEQELTAGERADLERCVGLLSRVTARLRDGTGA